MKIIVEIINGDKLEYNNVLRFFGLEDYDCGFISIQFEDSDLNTSIFKKDIKSISILIH